MQEYRFVHKSAYIRFFCSVLLIAVVACFSRFGVLLRPWHSPSTNLVASSILSMDQLAAAMDGLPFYGLPVKEELLLESPTEVRIDEDVVIHVRYSRHYEFASSDVAPSNTFQEFKEWVMPSSDPDKKIATPNVSRLQRPRELHSYTPPLGTDVSLYIQSPAFSQDEANKQTKTIGTPLPTTFSWVLTPKKLGRHILLVTYPYQLDEFPGMHISEQTISINGVEVDKNETRELKIPITVVTAWGLSEKMELVLKGILSLLSFVLMYPVITAFMTAFITSRAERLKDQKKRQDEEC